MTFWAVLQKNKKQIKLLIYLGNGVDIMDDYVVRYGNDNGYVERSDYMSKEQAEKFYNKIKLNIRTTWKELLYEPLEKEDVQEIIKSDSVKIVDLGICKMALPN